jgi:outer membrane protein TolC
MSRQVCSHVTWLLIVVIATTGCHPTQPFYLRETGDLAYFLDKATEIEYPDVEAARLADAEHSQQPLNVADPDFDHFWDVTLEEAVSITMQNSKVIRNLAAVTQLGFADGLVTRTAAASTVYDAALTESNTLGGTRQVDRSNGSLFLTELQTQATQQGVEDALSEFDAQFFSSVNYGTTDRPRNVQFGNPFNPVFFQQRNGNFLAALSKKTASGALFSVRNRTGYVENNIPIGIGRALPSEWQTEMEIEAQYPLLRGRGEQVNRIPIVLARINTDITLAEFEVSIRNLLMDVESTYWDLYLAYRAMETARAGFDAAQLTWKQVYDKFTVGQANARDEAQAREQFFFFQASLQQAQNELFESENRLRWLMGIAATDGRVVRPADEPVTAEVHFAWDEVRLETLMRRPELRQHRWRIKQRELELIAAKNQLLPRLNATALYRWVGVGDQLIDSDDGGVRFPDAGSNAFAEMTQGDFQEAFFGLEFTPPQFGARRPLAAVRHAQLQLARSHAQLEDMELNSVHLVGSAWRATKFRYTLASSQFDRWNASQREVESAQAEFLGGRVNLDFVLDAYRRRAQAQIDFYRALVDYNKAIADVHFQKGSLIEHNGIELAEGPWPKKAYWDALGRARERDASTPLRYGWTRPNVVSQGPVPQGSAGIPLMDGTMRMMPGAESIPAPEPTPADSNQWDDRQPPMEQPEPAPLPAPRPQVPVTRRPQGPALEAPSRAEVKSPSARRVAVGEQVVEDPQVVPASRIMPVAVEVGGPASSSRREARPAAAPTSATGASPSFAPSPATSTSASSASQADKPATTSSSADSGGTRPTSARNGLSNPLR